ncbi:phosphatase PAP2 family protein [Mycobacterium sp. ITM-2017-0098]|nr:phosphatase PAP2 family protein [Mycobacterium sp. ITM-2017-0098]
MRAHCRWLIGSAAAALVVYALLWVGFVQDWTWLAAIDDGALEPAHRFGQDRPGWVTAWDIYCTVLGPGAFRLVVLVIVIVALVRRQVRLAMFLVISVELSGLVTEVAKSVADRPRPDTAMVGALSTSFPSGHALGLMVAVAALLTVVLPMVRPSRRGRLIALGAVIVVTIGIGRVVLNVHHPSDVVAGWALGYAYFVVCVLLLPPVVPVTDSDGIPEALDSAR